MCGRYALFLDPDDFADEFGVAPPGDYETYNAAPGQSLPVVRVEDGERTAASAEWGFVPAWADDDRDGHVNARAESVREKPSFEDAYGERRCLVPASGFYEWRTESGGLQPYYFERRDDGPLAMAGVWSRFTPATTQATLDGFGNDSVTPVETFAVLTRAASGTVADYHDRAPVVVAPDDYGTWLAGDDPLDAVTAERPSFETRAVPRAVNDPANDAPELTRPVSSDGS